jgi:hypothetical protein
MKFGFPYLVAFIMGPVVVVSSKTCVKRIPTNIMKEEFCYESHWYDKVDKIGSKIDNHIGWHDGVKEEK